MLLIYIIKRESSNGIQIAFSRKMKEAAATFLMIGISPLNWYVQNADNTIHPANKYCRPPDPKNNTGGERGVIEMGAITELPVA